MSWWLTNGLVHVRGELQERQYLLRDVVMRLAARRHRQRRQFRRLNQAARDAAETPEPDGGCGG